MKSYSRHESGLTTLLTNKQKLTVVDRLCLVMYTIAVGCAGFVLFAFFMKHGHYNSTQYRMETDYLHWKTSIPAISVCEDPSESTLVQHATRAGSARLKVAKFYQSLLRPSDQGFCKNCEGVDCLECPWGNYTSLLHENLTHNCEALFKACYWNNEEIDCCSNFLLLMTEHGKCYTLNSRHTSQSRDAAMFRVQADYANGASSMKMYFNYPVQVFVHDAGDVSFIKKQLYFKIPMVDKPKTINFGQEAFIDYTLKEISSDETAHHLTRTQRNCTLPGEAQLKYYSRYSFTACRAECQIEKQLKLCNCTHHLITKKGLPVCDFKGLQCLQRYLWNPDNKTKKFVKKLKLKCQCIPECEFTEIHIIRNSVNGQEERDIVASIKLNSVPKERLILYSRVSTLETLVGLACISRLFMSGSILDLLQITCVVMRYLYLRYFTSRLHYLHYSQRNDKFTLSKH